MFKRFLKIFGISALALILLIGVVAYLLTQEKVQTRLAQEAAIYLSKKLDTKVSIKKVRIDLLNFVHFEELYLEDQNKDTLAFIGDFKIKSTSIVADLWNDKTTIIKQVSLSNGMVHLKRNAKSDEWNFSFIEKAFATDDEDTSSSDLPKIDLKNVALNNVRFKMNDQWLGQDIEAKVGELQLKINSVDLPKMVFNVAQFDIVHSAIVFRDYKGGKPPSRIEVADKSTWGTPFNTANLMLSLNNLNFKDLTFEYQLNNAVSKPGEFDERHIVARDIFLTMEDIQVQGDTLLADIVNLAAKERCGLEIKKMMSRVKLNQQIAELKNLYLETNRSVIRNYYSMEYQNFHDFNNYIEDVVMRARFRDCQVDKRDIAFFSGDIAQLPLTAKLNGIAEGTVANLKMPDVSIASSDLNFIGFGSIVGLPNVDNTIFNLTAKNLTTSGKEIIRIAPEANTDAIAWNALSSVTYKGNFIGKTQQFKAVGTLLTNLGAADINLSMDLQGKQPKYSGRFETNKLNVGEIIKQEDFGQLTATGTINGQGFDFEHLGANVSTNVSELYLQNERYRNISLSGSFKNKEFNGSANSDDPNLNFSFLGKVNLSKEKAVYDFKSDIVQLNLKTFGITPDDVFLKSKVLLDFEGNDIDNFIGKAIMQDVVLKMNNKEISIADVRLNSYNTDSLGKVLDLKSSLADARVVGRYSISGIDRTIRSFLHYYMPTFIKRASLPPNEIYNFDLVVKNANDIINIYNQSLSIDSGTVLKGDINTNAQVLNIELRSSGLEYDDIKFSSLGVVSKGTRDLFTSEILAGELAYQNNRVLQDARLNLAMSSDTARIQLFTKPTDDFLGESLIDVKVQAFADKLSLKINPSTFIIKDDKYRLFASRPIEYYNAGYVLAEDVIIENGTQQYLINAFKRDQKNNATLKSINVDLEKISNYINATEFKMAGRVNLDLKIDDIWEDTKIDGKAVSVDLFRVNTDTFGIANIQFTYLRTPNTLNIENGSTLNYQNSALQTHGKINFKDESLDLSAGIKKMPISLANKFVEDLVDSLSGYASGNLDIVGSFDNPSILGNMTMSKAKLRVLFTGCTYSFEDFKLKLDNQSITFDPITINDQRSTPGQAVISGSITHSNYDKYRLNLNAYSNNFLGLNTEEVDGELFYGYIPASFKMKIAGPLDDITMDIAAKPLTGAKFFLPLNSSGDAGTYDYIKFKTLGKFQDQDDKAATSASYFKVKMDIEATPDILATIILDPNTREKIEARGYGNINLVVDLGNEIKMYNTFTVKEGEYFFNFRGLLPNRFALDEGGTITWNGDAYDAAIDMDAVYKTRVALYPLISNEALDDNEIKEAKKKEETHVKVELTGPLSKPNIKFDISQPYNRNIGSIGLTKLQSIQQDQNELIYQASMILLFNSFKPVGGGVDAGSLATTTVGTTISDVVGSAISPAINNVINKITGTDNFSFNVNYKNYSSDVSSAEAYRRNQFDLDLSASLFQDRFILDIGNSLDFGNAGVQNGGDAFNYGGDFRGQYLLTLDGRYRLNAFRVSTYDYVDQKTVARGGIGLIYKKAFNTWGDLFRSKPIKPVSNFNQNINTPQESDSLNLETRLMKIEQPLLTALQLLSGFHF